jgi:hypothetical protein
MEIWIECGESNLSLYGDEWMNDKLMWAQLNSRQGIKSLESQELGNVIYIFASELLQQHAWPSEELYTLVAVTWMSLYWFFPRSVRIFLQITIQCVTITFIENFHSQKVNSIITTTAVFSDFRSCSHTTRQPPTCLEMTGIISMETRSNGKTFHARDMLGVYEHCVLLIFFIIRCKLLRSLDLTENNSKVDCLVFLKLNYTQVSLLFSSSFPFDIFVCEEGIFICLLDLLRLFKAVPLQLLGLVRTFS